MNLKPLRPDSFRIFFPIIQKAKFLFGPRVIRNLPSHVLSDCISTPFNLPVLSPPFGSSAAGILGTTIIQELFCGTHLSDRFEKWFVPTVPVGLRYLRVTNNNKEYFCYMLWRAILYKHWPWDSSDGWSIN